jgi:SWI/SNF-related matrix-associated actin-dependent regulator 1 of chromatin subfamily A
MLPAPTGLAYRPYQEQGIRHIISRAGSLLADDPGLGKTIQVAGALNLCSLERVRCLIVAPASLLINWRKELTRWLVRDRSISIWTTKRQPDTEIVIVNYDIISKLTFKLVGPWDIAVFDEAQYIKNPKAARTKAAMAVQATHRISLSGTPIVNRPIEAYPVIWWLMSGQVPSYMTYAKRFCDAHQVQRIMRGGRRKMVWDMTGASNLPELHELLNACGMLRRRKAEVLDDLPEKTRQIIELSGAEKLVKQEAKYKDQLERMESGEPVTITEFAELRHDIATAKVPLAIQFIEDALESEPAIFVVAHHRDVVDKLEEGLRPHGVVKIVGGMSPAQKDQAVQAFQGSNARICIGNSAAREGLTLTAAARVIFVELDPVPGNMIQFEDRTHRIGQKRPVLVQHLVFNGSLDVRIAKMLLAKQAVIDAAVEGQTEEDNVQQA